MGLITHLQSTNRTHWSDASIWLVYTLAGGLAPVWTGFLLLKIFSRHPSWGDFSHHGEFALYSATLFAPAFYVITRDLKTPGFAGRQVFGLVTFLGMIVSTCFFVGATTAFLEPKPLLTIDQSFLEHSTLGLFAAATLLAFVVTVFDNARLIPDVVKIAAHQQNQLSKEFDKLEKKP